MLFVLQGASFWFGFVACVFLADVLGLARPTTMLCLAASISALVAHVVVWAGGGLVAYVLVVVLGAVALAAMLSEAACVSPDDEDKPLVNIFRYFNPRAPLANVVNGAILGVSLVFLASYGAMGVDVAILAIVGVLGAGIVPRARNDESVNRVYVVALALLIGCIVVLPLDGKRAASVCVVGAGAFYFMRNVGWAFGQCLKLGSLDTAIMSRAMAPFLTGFACGCAAGALLIAAGLETVAVYVGCAMLFLLVVNAVYFLPYLASPFAREEAKDARERGDVSEHEEIARAILNDEPLADARAEKPKETPDPDAALRARCSVVAEEDGLTDRELDILLLLCKGRTASYIGEELFISKNTAKVHISHVYNKTGIHSQQELMRYVESVEVG